MKLENPNKKESLSVSQMVDDAAAIKAALLVQMEAAVVDIDTTHLEKLTELSKRCIEAFNRLDELVEQHNTDGSVRDAIFKFAYDNIKSVRDDVEAFLKLTPEERDSFIHESAVTTVEDNTENPAVDPVTSPDTTPLDSEIGKDPTPASFSNASERDNKDKAGNIKVNAPVRDKEPHPLREQVERLKQRDDAILYTDADKKKRFKGLRDLRLDIEALFDADGHDENSKETFYNHKFHGLAGNIIRNRTLWKKATPEERKKITESIKATYEQILTNAAVWLRNKEVYDEGGDTETIPDRGISEIETDIKEAEQSFEILQEQQKDNPAFKESSAYRTVQIFLKEIKNNSVTDPNLANAILEEHLHHLGEALDKLFLEFAGEGTFDGILDEEVDADAKTAKDFLSGVDVIELEGDPIDIGGTAPINIVDVPTPTPDPAPSPLPTADNAPGSLERVKQGEKSLEAKQQFRDIKERYHAALEAHQAKMNNESLFTKMKSLGIKPELPEAIKALEAEYLERRKVYATELDARLSQRSDKFTLSQDDMKRSFAKKFLINPHKEVLEMQERKFLSPEAKMRVRRIAGVLAKHKWTIRAGTVVLAGMVGAATGGTALAFAGAAGWQGVKIAGSATSAMLAGGAANVLTQKIVDKTTANLDKVAATFSLDTMNNIETDVLEASKYDVSARRYQKVATVVAGGLAGFAAGNGLANTVPDNVTALTQPTPITAPAPAASGGLSEEALANLRTSQVMPQIVTAPTTPEQAVATPEAVPGPTFIKEIALPFDSREGGLKYEHHISNVSLGAEFKPAALTELQSNELNSFIKLKISDQLAAHPNISNAKLESEILSSIEKRFGDSKWWADSPVRSVDVGKVEVVLVSGNPATPEIVNGEYIVQKGDTLWEIAEEKFADQLKDLKTDQERDAVLKQLFNRVEADPALMKSLSLDSGNNINLIKAGEEIELGGLEAELKEVLADKEIVEDFRKSAPLPVEADGGVKPGTINIADKTVPPAVVDLMINDKPYVEPVPTKPVITPEVTTSTKSYYEMSPDHVRSEIKQHFGNVKNFEIAVERAADRVGGRAYDFFEMFSNTYENPYNLVRDMTVERFEKLQAMPNAELRSFLTEQKIKYEAYLQWKYEISQLTSAIPHTKTDTIGALFEQSVFQDRVEEKANNELYRN